MTVRTARRAAVAGSAAWALAAALLGAAAGAAAAVNDRVTFALAVGVACAVALLRTPALLLSVLAASVFLDAVDVGVPLSRALAPLALVVVIAVAAARRPAPAPAPLRWTAAYAGWALASAAWTISTGATGFQVLSLAIALVYMAAFAVLIASERDLRRCLEAFVFTAVVVAVIAILAFVGHVPSLTQGGRAFGLSGDPNFFAMYQVMAIPLALALLAEAGGSRRRLLYAGIAVLVLSIFASASRGGLLSLGAIAALMLLAPARSLFDSHRQKLAILAALVVAGFGAVAVTGSAVTSRVESLNSADTTGSGRTALWRAAHTSIDERPLLGLGYGAFPDAVQDLLRRTPGIDFRHIELHPDKGSEAHDVYISTLAELGAPGLVLLLGLLVATARELRRVAATARRAGAHLLARTADALLLSLAGWSVASLFLTTESSRALWIVVGIAVALPRLVNARAASLQAAPRAPA
jgi:O-antigen ligase